MNRQDMVHGLYEGVFGGPRNVGRVEGLASIGLGLGMAAGGLQKADMRGAIMGLVGAYLVARGMTHHCAVKAAIQGGGGSVRLASRDGGRREMAARH